MIEQKNRVDQDMKTVLHFLSLMIIDIRATDDEVRIKQKASIIHNVPSKIARGETAEQAWQEIDEQAERFELQGKVASLRKTVENY